MPDGNPSLRFRADVAEAALAGLRADPKTLPSKLFYDDTGCALFDRITRLPEYYVTRVEMALLRSIASDIADAVPAGATLVEYGAGSEAKAAVLLHRLRDPVAYVPIDVAGPAIQAAAMRLRDAMPTLRVWPVEADFLAPIALPPEVAAAGRVGFFPGSTIGNLEPSVAVRFLRQAICTLGPEAMFLVGADLRKSPDVLIPAYDDAQGVTAEFNLNILVRLNRDAAADFALDRFVHRAVWNAAEGRIEMHLESLRDQVAHVAGQRIEFRAGETIHTENSYKHTREGFSAIARDAGWRVARSWTDPDELFAVYLLKAGGEAR